MILEDIPTFLKELGNGFTFIEQDKTIGIIICKKDNKYILEYCSDRRIISKKYELV